MDKEIIPILPSWAKEGCVVLEVWDDEITSGTAVGVGTYVKYKDKKGKIRSTLKWVKWLGGF